MLLNAAARRACLARSSSASSARVSARPFTSSRAAPRPQQQQQSRSVQVGFFNFNKSAPDADTGSGEYNRREDYTYQDVEDYFNYMGFLADEGSYDRMEALLATGIEHIDAILVLAASQNDTPKIKEALKCGANPHAKDQDGKTALDLATKEETRALIQAALQVKA